MSASALKKKQEKNKNLQQIQEWGVTPHSRKTRRKKVV
jgi:hypothetical protein